MNKVVLVGRLTKEPEIKRTPTDLPYVQFTLAVNRNYQSKGGERQADFISCIAWRQTAELLARYMHKGSQIGIDGQIQTRTYDDNNGIRHYVTEVLTENVYFLEPKKDASINPFAEMDVTNEQPYRQNYNNQNQGYNNQQNYYNRPYQQTTREQQAQMTSRPSMEQKEQGNPFDGINNLYNISNDDLPF